MLIILLDLIELMHFRSLMGFMIHTSGPEEVPDHRSGWSHSSVFYKAL